MEAQSVGHGIDSGDKAPGKAMTYAFKQLLLYIFAIPVGNIDDSDSTHSEAHEVPSQPRKSAPANMLDNSPAKPSKKAPKLFVAINKGMLTPAGKKWILAASNEGKEEAIKKLENAGFRIEAKSMDYMKAVNVAEKAAELQKEEPEVKQN
jgi:hypothetical protein